MDTPNVPRSPWTTTDRRAVDAFKRRVCPGKGKRKAKERERADEYAKRIRTFRLYLISLDVVPSNQLFVIVFSTAPKYRGYGLVFFELFLKLSRETRMLLIFKYTATFLSSLSKMSYAGKRRGGRRGYEHGSILFPACATHSSSYPRNI